MSEGIIVAIVTGIFSTIAIVLNAKMSIKKKKDYNVELKFHPFFARAEMLKNQVDHTFSIENKGKEKVFKDIIKSQIITFQDVLLDVATEIDNNKITDSTHLYNKHLEALDDIIRLHHSYYKCNPDYTIEEQHVLDIVMNKYDMWHQSKITFLQENIMSICNSPFYDTELVKGAVILDIYLSMTIDTINDASRTLNRINGDLKGLKFKDVII